MSYVPGEWGVKKGTLSIYTNYCGSRNPTRLKIANTKQPLLTEECQEANAKLMSAAPELLSMVQEFIFTLQDEHGSYYVDGNIIKGKALWEKASGETWKDEELEEDDDEVEVEVGG